MMLSEGIPCLEENRLEAEQEAQPYPACSAETTKDL